MSGSSGADEAASVVLDIGGDVGALIVHTGASMRGVEIEIRPNDEHGSDVFQAEHPHEAENDAEHDHTHDHGHTHDHSHSHGDEAHTHGDDEGTHTHTHAHTPGTTHVEVLERTMGGAVHYAAIYPGLREGEYTLLNQDGTPADTVRIVGGEVVELDWS